ncbi:MAG TPA: hypothetical protein ENJ57_05925 [Rhizobiales bacterium]|nr:hypothetical protein [Hyphomicrobiales bacterium]
MFWHSGWSLRNLEGVGATGPYFFTHISPLLYIPDALSYILPFGRETWFSLVMALMHGGLAALAFILIRPCMSRFKTGQGPVALLITLALAVLFGLNGIILRSLWIGHFEFIIPILLITLFMALAAGRKTLAIVNFVLLCAAREDGGLHGALFLAAYIAFEVFSSRKPLRDFRLEIAFILIGSAYSLFCIFYLMPILAGDDTIASSLYFGHPPFGHVTAMFMAGRAKDYLVENTHLYLPLILISAFAIFTRRWIYFAAILAVLPWSLVHFLAVNPDTGMMYSYKAFPFLVVFLWPFLAERLAAKTSSRICPSGKLPALLFVVVLSGMFAFRPDGSVHFAFDEKPAYSLLWPETAMRAGFEDFRAALLARHGDLGHAVAAPGAARLHPGLFRDNDVLVWYFPKLLTPRQDIDTIIYQTGGRSRQMAESWARANGHDHLYRVRGTSFRITANRDLTALDKLGPLLLPLPISRLKNQAPDQEPLPNG